jgi:hypothetical protein
MTHKLLTPDIERAAATIQLTVAMTQTLEPAELGNDLYQHLFETWIRSGHSMDWIIDALDQIEDIKRISFVKGDADKWMLDVEWE